jgi:hypothetical protein
MVLITRVLDYRLAGGRTDFTESDDDKILRWLMYHHPHKTNWKSVAIYRELASPLSHPSAFM